MKAALYSRVASPHVVQVLEAPQPVPKDNEVLIKVRAAAVNPLDWHIGHLLFGLFASRGTPAGRDVAGVAEAVGRGVTQFKPGDEVFGVCRGAFAEYACAREAVLVAKPTGVTFEQAASAPVAAYTALQGLRDKGRLLSGQKVLVNGAAGGVGTFTVQIARWLGAVVTGVCSTRNVQMVQSLGANHVVDYTREDFTQSGQRYDVIFDLVANHSLSECARVLNPKGTYIGAGILALHGSAARILGGLLKTLVLSPFVSQKVITFTAKSSQEDLMLLGELMATGKVRPVIDRRYRLSEVPDAIRYVAEGHARGKVVITPEDNATGH